MAHAKKCPPSSADRWMECGASVPLILQLMSKGELKESDLDGDDNIDEDAVIEFGNGQYGDVVLDPSRESTSFSAEGTVMHEVRQLCLELGLNPMHFAGCRMGADGFTFDIDEDMCDRLVAGIDWIRQHTAAPHVEVRVDLSEWLPEQFGTCDTFWLVPVRRSEKFDLYISDYKNGVGEPVEAEGNRQLRLYALGAWAALGKPQIRNVILNIDQPRAGGMKFWEITFDELMAFGDEVKAVWDRIDRGDVEFVPTKKGCRWCPVRKSQRGCAAYNRWMLLMFNHALLDPSQGEPKFDDPEQINRATRFYIVKHSSLIRAWLTKLYEESLAAATRGDPDPGSKAVMGPEGNRYFSDEDDAKRILISALGRKAFKPRKLIGMTEIDKLMKPGRKKEGFPDQYEALQPLIRRAPASVKLVDAGHPKPAYQPVSDDDFDDLPEKGSNQRLGDLADAFDDL